MNGREARILVTLPEGWMAVPLPPPDVSQTPEVSVLDWHAWAPPGKLEGEQARLVTACFGGETHAWTDEVEPMVLDRLRAVVSSTALRLDGVGGLRVASMHRTGRVTTEWLDGSGEAESRLAARTFLGFADSGDPAAGHLVGCFALCIADLHGCRTSVERATVEGTFVDAPHPTLSVRALVAMVHHPTATFGSLALLCALVGILAVVTRKRPRTK